MLLDAAETELAAQGYAEASLNTILKASGRTNDDLILNGDARIYRPETEEEAAERRRDVNPTPTTATRTRHRACCNRTISA